MSEPEKPDPSPWTQWQLLDSLLPTGAFAHSSGLESAIQTRFVSKPEHLHLHTLQILHSTAALLLPFVHSAALSPTPQTLQRLNKTLDATITNEIARKSSISQGSSLLRVSFSIFPELPSLKAIKLKSGGGSMHHAAVFGMIFGALGIDSETAQRAFLFVTMRDVLSAATRMNVIGPLGAAAMQRRMGGEVEEMAVRWMNREVGEACQICPVLDAIQGCHGYLLSRMFCS